MYKIFLATLLYVSPVTANKIGIGHKVFGSFDECVAYVREQFAQQEGREEKEMKLANGGCDGLTMNGSSYGTYSWKNEVFEFKNRPTDPEEDLYWDKGRE